MLGRSGALLSTEVDLRADWRLELATPLLLKDLGILVHIFTSTYEITTSNHAAQTNALSFSRHHFVHGGEAMWQ